MWILQCAIRPVFGVPVQSVQTVGTSAVALQSFNTSNSIVIVEPSQRPLLCTYALCSYGPIVERGRIITVLSLCGRGAVAHEFAARSAHMPERTSVRLSMHIFIHRRGRARRRVLAWAMTI